MICAKEDFFPFHIKQVEADNPDIKLVWHVCSKWKYCLNIFGNEVFITAARKDQWWESLNLTLILVILIFERVFTYHNVFQSCSWEPPAPHVIHVSLLQHSWFKCRAWWWADHLYQVCWVRETNHNPRDTGTGLKKTLNNTIFTQIGTHLVEVFIFPNKGILKALVVPFIYHLLQPRHWHLLVKVKCVSDHGILCRHLWSG